MKTTSHFLFALAGLALLAAACSKESSPLSDDNEITVIDEVLPSITITANLPDGSTKAAIDATDPTKINWATGDKISVYSYKATYPYAPFIYYVFSLSSSSNGSSSGTFTYDSSSVNEFDFDNWESSTVKYAFYPKMGAVARLKDFDSYYKDNEDPTLECYPKEEQVAVPGSFDPESSVMVGAISNNNEVTFQHVMGYLKIKTPSDAASLVSITVSTNGEHPKPLTGFKYRKVLSDLDQDYIQTPVLQPKNYVTLVPPTGEKFLADTYYYAAVIPGTYSEGLTITYVYKDNENYVGAERIKSSSTSLTLARGHVKTIGCPGTMTTGNWDTSRDAVQLWEKRRNQSFIGG